jgi:hypothetical protein
MDNTCISMPSRRQVLQLVPVGIGLGLLAPGLALASAAGSISRDAWNALSTLYAKQPDAHAGQQCQGNINVPEDHQGRADGGRTIRRGCAAARRPHGRLATATQAPALGSEVQLSGVRKRTFRRAITPESMPPSQFKPYRADQDAPRCRRSPSKTRPIWEILGPRLPPPQAYRSLNPFPKGL